MNGVEQSPWEVQSVDTGSAASSRSFFFFSKLYRQKIQNCKNYPSKVAINKLPSPSHLRRDCDRRGKGGVDFRDLEVHA